MANSLLAQAAAAYNSGRHNSFPTSGPVAPLSFATTPQGQREMDNVRAQLQADIARNQQAAQRRAMFRTPAAAPPIGMLQQPAGEMAPTGNTLVDLSPPPLSAYDWTEPRGASGSNPLADMATAYNQQATIAFQQRTPPGRPSTAVTPQELQHNADFDARFQQQRDLAQAQQQAVQLAQDVGQRTQTGIRPDQSASAGLLAGNPAADGGMFGDTRWQAGGRMSGYRPQSVGMADPRTREAQMRQQAPAAPVDAAEQLRQMAPGLMNYAGASRNGPVLQLTGGANNAGLAGQQGAAERLREMLSPEQQAQIQIPTGIRGSEQHRKDGVVAGSREFWQQRQLDPSYQMFAAKQQALANEAKQRLAQRNQRAQDAADGIDPSFRRAQEMLLGGGGAPAAGGQFAPGGMNAGQIGALAFMYGPELAAQAMKFNADVASQQAAHALAAGQLGLQQQMVQQRADQEKQIADAALPDSDEGDQQRIVNAGGFGNLTPARQQRIITRIMGLYGNRLTDPEFHQHLAKMGISKEQLRQFVAANPVPQYQPGFWGGLGNAIRGLFGDEDPTQPEQEWRRRPLSPEDRARLPRPGASAVPR